MEDQKTDGSHLVISFRMINSLTILCWYIKKKTCRSAWASLMREERVTIQLENEGLTACKCMCPIMRNATATAQLIAQSGICTSWRIIKNLTKILLTYRNGKTFTVGHKYITPLLLNTPSHCHELTVILSQWVTEIYCELGTIYRKTLCNTLN